MDRDLPGIANGMTESTVFWKSIQGTILGALAKLRKAAIRFVMSVRPQGTTRLLPDGFSLNLIFKYFSKICPGNSSFIKIWQAWRILYMKTSINVWSYLAQFFSEWIMFQRKVVEKIETHISSSMAFYFKSCRLWDVGVGGRKHGSAGETTDDNMALAHCMLDT